MYRYVGTFSALTNRNPFRDARLDDANDDDGARRG